MTRHTTRTARTAAGRALVVAALAAAGAVAPVGARMAYAVASPAGTAVATQVRSGTPAGAVAQAAPRVAVLATARNVSPHGPYTTTSDQCAGCHRAHTAKSSALLVDTAPQSKLCFTCHDGTGSSLNVAAQYTDPSVKTNDPTTSSYYQHDISKPTAHILASGDEFGGVFNRHTECSDCHDPHQGSLVNAAGSPTGTPWTPSGRLSGTSGVAVTYSGPGAPSAYTFLDGGTQPITAEYQLCFKCHSGFTQLLPHDPAHPSTDMLDAATEFNPASTSFHPVLAPGTNQTAAMTASLAGDSPSKLWNFTVGSTVRCTNCHASAITMAGTTSHPATNTPTADSDLPTHASSFRGVLIQNYQDRVLKTAADPYTASDFALCYLCHTDSPFTADSGVAATNFTKGGKSLHYLHVSNIRGIGTPGTSIDQAAAGDGNALCAECHFRIHSTATTAAQDARLISFAPNVTAVSGSPVWTATATGGSCALVCHGTDHQSVTYGP